MTTSRTILWTEAARAYSNDGKTEVRSFTIPDQQWTYHIASALVEYAQGTGKWDKVQSAFVDGWSTEWNNNEESLGFLCRKRRSSTQRADAIRLVKTGWTPGTTPQSTGVQPFFPCNGRPSCCWYILTL